MTPQGRKQWPIRTPLHKGKRIGAFRTILGVDYFEYRCDLGHEMSSGLPQGRWCRHCVELLAYSVERLAASLGERVRRGRFPHMPDDGRTCDCHRRGEWEVRARAASRDTCTRAAAEEASAAIRQARGA